MHRKNQIRVESLSRMLSYILGHRPDEFGLVPDSDGFVSYKELLWAFHEESGWSYVKQGDIREVLMGKDRNQFESDENRIRAKERHWSLESAPFERLPRVLYVAIRKRAHAHVMEKGLASEDYVVLSGDSEFALRIGRRRDPKPVLLQVLTPAARDKGASFVSLGGLYLSREIPPGCLSGPPVEEELPVRKPEKAGEEKTAGRREDFMPGSFLLDLNRDPATYRREKGKRQRSWKEKARKFRKRKNT